MAKLPTKKRLRQIADKLWSAAVKADWADKCAVCGTPYDLEAHHLIRRTRSALHRYTLKNGISLCTSHHKFDATCSPHGGDVGFNSWLRLHHEDIEDWVLAHQHEHMDGQTTSQGWYLDRITELAEYVDEDTLRTICGVKLTARIKAAERKMEA